MKKLTKRIIAVGIIVSMAIGVTKNLGTIESKASEGQVKEEIDKLTREEIRSLETVEFEEYFFDNGEIRLVSNKEDGYRIITEIKSTYSSIKYYNQKGEEISSEYIDYKRLVSSNSRKLEPTYDKFGGNYYYHDLYNESLIIGCKAIYEIQYNGLSADQIIRINDYKNAIDNINSAMKKVSVLVGISIAAFAPVAVYAMAKYLEGMAVSAIAAACKVKFPTLLFSVSEATLSAGLGHLFGISDDRETMKAAYEDIKIWGKKIGTVRK